MCLSFSSERKRHPEITCNMSKSIDLIKFLYDLDILQLSYWGQPMYAYIYNYTCHVETIFFTLQLIIMENFIAVELYTRNSVNPYFSVELGQSHCLTLRPADISRVCSGSCDARSIGVGSKLKVGREGGGTLIIRNLDKPIVCL